MAAGGLTGAGCDAGTAHDQAPAGAPVQVIQQNVSPTQPLAPDGRIELAFNRYLLPSIITRQTFSLRDAAMNAVNPVPTVAYDPVARIVTITPVQALQADQSFNLVIAGPNDPVNAVRAIDGATMVTPKTIAFQVTAGDGGATGPLPTVDFCKDIYPVFKASCSYGSPCHVGATATSPPKLPPEGLELDSPDAIAQTAIGRVSQEANTGPRAAAQPPGRLFGVDMPIIDPGNGATGGGNPGNSWLLYKLLLAGPSDVAPSTTMTDVSTLHTLAPPAVLASERAILANYVLGREMPFPTNPATNPSVGLANDELERISRWIAQPPPSGTLTPACP